MPEVTPLPNRYKLSLNIYGIFRGYVIEQLQRVVLCLPSLAEGAACENNNVRTVHTSPACRVRELPAADRRQQVHSQPTSGLDSEQHPSRLGCWGICRSCPVPSLLPLHDLPPARGSSRQRGVSGLSRFKVAAAWSQERVLPTHTSRTESARLPPSPPVRNRPERGILLPETKDAQWIFSCQGRVRS